MPEGRDSKQQRGCNGDITELGNQQGIMYAR
jgi:hypothetical protein